MRKVNMNKDEVTPEDIVGEKLGVGDTVAFCLAGTSSDMRLGKVVKVNKKTVSIEYDSWPRYDGKVESITVMRAFDSVVVVEHKF